MPRYFVHATFFLFMVTAVSGMWMRWYPFLSNPLIAYDHVLHGHSHLAILGWAFLGVFIIFLAILWPKIENKRHAIFLMRSEEHTSELQSRGHLVCRLLLEKKNKA